MNWKLTDRVVAGVVFLYGLVLYSLTVAPTASFWDSGEFIAIANLLEVSHPPGAPFYMLVGRLFSMFAPVEYVALSVNFVSVLASAVTVLLTFLIIVRLVREWQGPADTWTGSERITALVGGVVGAATFAATDSFWFNAVESEVYALSMCFTAVTVWLILKWSEQAQAEEAVLSGGQHPFGLRANRYLVLIAYMFGLAIGVHLLNLLAVFFVALIFFFTEIEKPSWDTWTRWRGIVLTGVVSSLAFLMIYPGIIQMLPTLAETSGVPVLFVLLVIGAVSFAVYYTHTRAMATANLVMLCIAVVLIGYSTYAVIFIRSAADPPIDENDPETTEAIISYLKREQYGQTPLLKGANYDPRIGQINYDEEVLFPRRHSPDPNHINIYRQYESDWDFFWQYQVGHMYVRYFLWQFVGRSSDVQDAPPATGFRFVDERAGRDDFLRQTPSERESKNVYYALPLLLGLIGAGFHFSRDWRRAFSVLVLFLVTGIGIILYLNQTPMQPRERDYSFVASFFAFSVWVGIGATGMLELTREAIRKNLKERARQGMLLGLGALLFLAVPGWMAKENYFDHDRSGNYVAPDYAYNLLNSLDEHAIVFTNGDNDTFPLWYMQEVERERRDVRVVNLSLLNTSWYIKQLKNQSSRESTPLPISMSDENIEDIGVRRWDPRTIELPVDPEQFETESDVFLPRADTNLIMNPMRWRLEGRPYNDEFNILYAADQATLDIVATNAQQGWQRPVYFAVTVSPDGQLDLQDFFHLEGQAFQVVPIRHNQTLGRIVPSVTPQRLMNFRFRNVADPNVYFDENVRRMVDNYRNIFGHTAQSLAQLGDREQAIAVLDTIMTKVPFETIPGDERSYLLLARAYQSAGASEKAVELIQGAEPLVLHRLESSRSSQDIDMAAQYIQILRASYLDAGAFEAAADFSARIAEVMDDSSYRQSPEEFRRLYEQSTEPNELVPGS
ncbi:MAG: DUF2723 domain-containing protein [Rhodothermales bacterium]